MSERPRDPFRFTTIAHGSRAILGPVTEAGVESLLARVPATPGARVLDVGCGKGALLVQALRHTGGTGMGVEPNPEFAHEARERLKREIPAVAAEIRETTLAEARLPEHAFSFGVCTGSLHAFGDWPTALRGMARLVAPDGWALLGPGYWQRQPEPEYLAAIGAQADEQASLLGTLAEVRRAGWRVVACHESTHAEWDAYESAYATRMREWCDAHADDPDAPAFRERIEAWGTAYTRWGRDTMGYALVLVTRVP